VQSLFYCNNYAKIYVDYPDFCRNNVLQAVNELPEFSVVTVKNSFSNFYSFIPSDMSDARICGLHLALKMEIRTDFFGFGMDFIFLNPYSYSKNVSNIKKNNKNILNNLLTIKKRINTISAESHKSLIIVNHYLWKLLEMLPESTLISPSPATKPVLYKTKIFNVTPGSVKYITREIPLILYEYTQSVINGTRFDYADCLSLLLSEAINSFSSILTFHEINFLNRYYKKLISYSKNRYGLMELLITAAKSGISDVFAVHLHHLAGKYCSANKSRFPSIEFMPGQNPNQKNRSYNPRFLQLNLKDHTSILKRIQRNPSNHDLILRPFSQRRVPSFESRVTSLVRTALFYKKKNYTHCAYCVLFLFSPFDRIQFPWKGRLSARLSSEADILFYATHPCLEQSFGIKSETIFGGFLFYSPCTERITHISRHDERYTHYADSENTADNDPIQFEDKLVTHAAYNTPAPCVLYISHERPSKKHYKIFSEAKKEIVYVPLSFFPKPSLQYIMKYKSLGYGRAKELLHTYPEI